MFAALSSDHSYVQQFILFHAQQEGALQRRAALMNDPILVEAVSKIWGELDHVTDESKRKGGGGEAASSSLEYGEDGELVDPRVLLEEPYVIFHRYDDNTGLWRIQ